MTVQEAIRELHNIRPLGGIIPQKRAEAIDIAIKCMEEVEQYRALGTVEELKEAREKQVAKKPNIVGGEFIKLAECSECNTVIRFKQEYCHKCGNKVNWEEGETSD